VYQPNIPNIPSLPVASLVLWVMKAWEQKEGREGNKRWSKRLPCTLGYVSRARSILGPYRQVRRRHKVCDNATRALGRETPIPRTPTEVMNIKFFHSYPATEQSLASTGEIALGAPFLFS